MSVKQPAPWVTPEVLLRAGAVAGDITCVSCGEAPWDGEDGASAAPACRSCRRAASIEFRSALAIVARDLADAHRHPAA